MWFGTDQGLLSFDNHKFRLLNTDDGLPDPEILNIWEDSRQNLWISCFQRRPCYRKHGEFITSPRDSSLYAVNFQAGFCNYYEDESRRVWLTGASTIAYRLDQNKSDQHSFPSDILYIHKIGENLYALATKSVILFNNLDPVLIFQFLDEEWVSNGTEGLDINGNRVLYSFKDRIILIEINGTKVHKIKSIKNLSGRVYTDRSNRFWVCSPSKGAICFDNQKRDLSNPKVYLPGKKVTSMFEDNQGTFWFCTLDDGIYGLPIGAPITYSQKDGIPSNNLVSVTRDYAGRILFGDDEGNLNILKNGHLAVERFHSTDGYNRLLAITPLSPTENWIVTDEGIYVQHGDKNRTRLGVPGSPKAILPDGDSVWCGTSAGLTRVSRQTNQFQRYTIQRVTAIEKDSEGIVWIGGIEGLHNSTDSFLSNQGQRHPELLNRIIAIKRGGPNLLWVATPEHGLLRVRVQNGQVTHVLRVNARLKQPISGIHSLHLADDGRLWIATNRGIFGLNPTDFSVLRYNYFDGLANNDIKSIFVHEDTLWAATPSGLTRMLVSPLPAQGQFPTYITTVRYRNEEAVQEIYLNDVPSSTKTTVLPLDATLVEVDFAGLDYRSRGNLMFDCIITEQRPPMQWITTDYLIRWAGNGFEDRVDTTRLYKSSLDFGVTMPPGKYNLRVVALTQNNVYGRMSDEWTIVMPAHWYSTVWFSALLWSVVGLIIYRFYTVQAQVRNMAFAVARLRLMALQAQINPHFIGNALNAAQRFFYPPDPVNASQYNTAFTRMLRKTLNYSESSFISFAQEVEYVRDFLEMARLRYGDKRFAYTITGTEQIPEDMPYPSLFLQPILENATIHGIAPIGISTVRVDYRIRDGRLICTVTDNGSGLNSTTKERTETDRISKGTQILEGKAAALNELFDLNMHLSVVDLAASTISGQGTQATVSFDVEKIQAAMFNQYKLDKLALPFRH